MPLISSTSNMEWVIYNKTSSEAYWGKLFFFYSNCLKTCINNTYGDNCQNTCKCNTTTTSFCDIESGFCTCKTDWTGEKCEQPCGDNRFLYSTQNNDPTMTNGTKIKISSTKKCDDCVDGVCQNTTGVCR